MTRTRKNLKTVCVKFFGKIGRTLVADSFKVNLSNPEERLSKNVKNVSFRSVEQNHHFHY